MKGCNVPEIESEGVKRAKNLVKGCNVKKLKV